MKKRAQAAMEYLLVGSLITLIIIPTIYIFYGYSQRSNEEVRQSQLNKVGTDIVDVAEQVYYLGEPSKVTIDEAMPDGIIGIEVWDNQELVFFLNDGSEISFKSKVNITTTQPCIGRCYGTFTERFHSPGLKRIIIESKEDHVFIREAGDEQIDQTDIKPIYCDEDDDTHYSIEEAYFCPSGRSDTEQGDDCDDTDPLIYFGTTEICNNKDDDCDNIIDGITRSCYTGQEGTEGIGECLAGEETCSAGTFGSCIGEITPVAEICDDNKDNDCDGDTSCDDSDCDEDLICICECFSGPCCNGCYYKASGAQPTGFTDDTDGFCSGSPDSETICTNGATGICYVLTRDYYCNGIDADEYHTDDLEDTCETCEYCTDNDLTCNYYSSSIECSSLQDCDYLNNYHITGTQSATSTSDCKYEDYNDNYRYCNGAGSCSSLICPLGSDTTTATAGTCKYISGCSGSTPGTVSNYATGTSCGTNLECDGNGNCVGACECSSGDNCCSDGCNYDAAGTACGTKDCDYLNYYYTSGTNSCTSTSYCIYRNYYDETRYCDSSGNCGNPTCDSSYPQTKATCGTCKVLSSCSSSSQSCGSCPNGMSCGSCSTCQSGACYRCGWYTYGSESIRVSSYGSYVSCTYSNRGSVAWGSGSGGCGGLPQIAYQNIFWPVQSVSKSRCICS